MVSFRFEERRGGESYRPSDRPGRSPSRGYDSRHRRSPPRNRSRLRADTWVPSNRSYNRPRSRSPPDYRRRSRTPPPRGRGYHPPGSYARRRSPPRRHSPRREDRIRSPPASWRSRSPQSDSRSRDVSRGRGSPRFGREPHPDVNKNQSNKRPALGAPTFPDHTGAKNLSRRPSPLPYVATARAPLRSRSRSPARQSPTQRSSDHPGPSSFRNRDSTVANDLVDSIKRPGNLDAFEKDTLESVQARNGNNVPNQPRNTSISQSPPLGSNHESKMASNTHRSSQHLSLLSAPTRPRRGPGPRDGHWGGGPVVRRGAPASTPSNAPSGPRASFLNNSPNTGFSGPGSFRHSISRPSNTAHLVPPAAPKAPNHLAGLGTILPGGQLLPLALDAATEKRISQLEADQEKLLERLADAQRLKRAGLRDWDRLDRETSICALKSELAEGHLQRMADESLAGGIPF